eukprot:scaffold4050_cov55-Cylindrotheca_fusiformis.AAC.6
MLLFIWKWRLLFVLFLFILCNSTIKTTTEALSSANDKRTRTKKTTTSISNGETLSFQFAPNGVCVSPKWFVVVNDNDNNEKNKKQKQKKKYFTLRNVPGDGDCMFLAVALAAATSMGLGGNNALLRAISQETRHVVAQVLESSSSSSKKKHLYIANGRLCSTNDLLQQATREVGLKDDDTDQYLKLLRTEGSKGGIQGGGPELTVLANVLRRPISIYELAAQPLSSNSKNATITASHHHRHHSSPSSSSKHNKEQQQQQQRQEKGDDDDDEYCCNIVCKGTFGKDLFSDPCASIPDSAVLMPNLQPGAYSWELHILILNVSSSPTAEEKHACVLLPQSPI